MIHATRRLEFDAAHRVLRHESKCKHLHGHRYRVDITLGRKFEETDDLGRVIDFGCVKEIIGKWIDDHLDHNIILHPEDPLLGCFPCSDREIGDEQQQLSEMFGGKKPYLMPGSHPNPTAENLAYHLFGVAKRLLSFDHPTVVVKKVRVYETPNCWADCRNVSD